MDSEAAKRPGPRLQTTLRKTRLSPERKLPHPLGLAAQLYELTLHRPCFASRPWRRMNRPKLFRTNSKPE